MGTDIHVVVQVRKAGQWITLPYRRWYDIPCREVLANGGVYERKGRPLKPGEVDAPEALSQRNYDLFAMLGNVRNGTGFAGCVTGEGWTPLTDSRGLPEDFVQPDWAEADEEEHGDDVGDHSFSWATLKELQAFNWDQSTTQYGVITLAQYAEWDGQTSPPSYSGWVSGGRTLVIEQAGWEGLTPREQGEITRGKDVYLRVSWQETGRQAAREFVEEVIPWLASLAPCPHCQGEAAVMVRLGDDDSPCAHCGGTGVSPEGGDNVRLVFGFDS